MLSTIFHNSWQSGLDIFNSHSGRHELNAETTPTTFEYFIIDKYSHKLKL